METINVADAKSHLSELLSRVSAGERFLIHRRERPVAVLIGPDELQRLERNSRVARRLAAALGQDEELLEAIERGEVHPAMAAFGLWRDDPEMDDLAERIAANRAAQVPRQVPGAVKILDSDHWIAILRRVLDLRGRVAADEELAITAISVGELVYGAERSARPAEKLVELDALLASATVLPYDDMAAQRFGAIKVLLERRGERLADADLQIAAIALTRAAPLVTHNGRHFGRIPGLSIEDWLEENG